MEHLPLDEMQKVFDIVTKTLALREAELSVAKALCARAAQALEAIDVLSFHTLDIDKSNLIAELRKAATE